LSKKFYRIVEIYKPSIKLFIYSKYLVTYSHNDKFGYGSLIMKILSQQNDPSLGCIYSHVDIDSLPNNIKVCLININTYQAIAEEISKIILDDSWMNSLDPTIRKAYNATVQKTANKLNDICLKVISNPQIEEDFGEIMVSITASQSLNQLFDHLSLPISELWKEKRSGNPGFDFHTVCPADVIHFGEAKYSSSKNPYTDAIKQADGFVREEKHIYDIIYLEKIIRKKEPIDNLDQNRFSIIAAFSINSNNSKIIVENAIKKISEYNLNTSAQNIYLVGVIC